MEPKRIKTRDKVLTYLETNGPSSAGDIAQALVIHEVTTLYHIQKLVQSRKIQHTSFRKTKGAQANIYSTGFDKSLPPPKQVKVVEKRFENSKKEWERKAEALQARIKRSRDELEERHATDMARLLEGAKAKEVREKERLEKSIVRLLEKQKIDLIRSERRFTAGVRKKEKIVRIKRELRQTATPSRVEKIEAMRDQEETRQLISKRKRALENAEEMLRKPITPFGWLIDNAEKGEPNE